MQEGNSHIQTVLAGVKSVDDLKEFLRQNFIPLVDQVTSLRTKYDKQVQQNIELKNMVDTMSRQMAEASDVITKLKKKIEVLKISNGTAADVAQEESKEDDDEPWLFYCKKSTSLAEVKRMLQFKESVRTLELDCSNWTSEYDMWKAFHYAVVLSKGKGQSGVELALTKDQFKSFAVTQLTNACAGEMLIFVKGFPLAQKSAKYTEVVLCIAALGEVMSNCWKELETTRPQVLGKVAIVIESEAEIPTLSVETEEANFMLSVEPLFEAKKN